jgi:hypothetical protein
LSGQTVAAAAAADSAASLCAVAAAVATSASSSADATDAAAAASATNVVEALGIEDALDNAAGRDVLLVQRAANAGPGAKPFAATAAAAAAASTAASIAASTADVAALASLMAACDQRLTLVHFTAQLEPCLSQENTLHTQHPLPPPEHGLHNPYAHPLSHTKRSSCAEKWTSVSPSLRRYKGSLRRQVQVRVSFFSVLPHFPSLPPFERHPPRRRRRRLCCRHILFAWMARRHVQCPSDCRLQLGRVLFVAVAGGLRASYLSRSLRA